MPQTIEAEHRILGKVFGGDYSFIIPPYQRPYSWTEEQVSELFDDLDTAINHNFENIEDIPPYFLGSVVLIKKSKTDTKADVVDGQQRLTTLTILFSVLRTLTDEEKRKNEIDEYILTKANELAGRAEGFRLRLRPQDSQFFEEHIQKHDGIKKLLNGGTAEFFDSQKRIYENAKFLQDKFRSYTPERRHLLMQFLIQRCFLVVVSTSDSDSAYRIFSVMNTRGLDLSPTDILKADITSSIPNDDHQEYYTTRWEEIEDHLGRDKFQDLFTHIRMIHMKSKQRGTLNKEFKDHVLKGFAKRPSKFIDDVLLPYSEAYKVVSKENHSSTENAEDVNKYLQCLKRLDNDSWMPSAILFFHKHKNDKEELLKFTRDLERLAYALFIRRANINERIGRYARVLESIEESQDLFVSDSPLQLSLDEKEDFKNRLNEPIYTVPRITKPLLLRLDSILAKAKEGAIYPHQFISVEHVLPQTPGQDSRWMKSFPDEGEREYWVHRLANLVLLSHRRNISASNGDFDQKKEKYCPEEGDVGLFALTVQALRKPEWTPEVLEQRQRYLCETLAKEWRL